MILNTKCNNCGHQVSQKMIDEKKGYKINDKFFVCDKCYRLYLDRAKEYLYKYPNSDIKIVAKMTGLPASLIIKFCDEEDLIRSVNNELLANELKKQEFMEEKEEFENKAKTIQALRDSLNESREASMQKVINERASSKMRFLNTDHGRRH